MFFSEIFPTPRRLRKDLSRESASWENIVGGGLVFLSADFADDTDFFGILFFFLGWRGGGEFVNFVEEVVDAKATFDGGVVVEAENGGIADGETFGGGVLNGCSVFVELFHDFIGS